MVTGSSLRLDCSVDLKLGGLGEFRSSEQGREINMVSASKRARAVGSSSHNAACLVDGCKSDLSHGRDYHRRHKVCEVHSKTPIVLVGGQEQRFCQQCSKFHMLTEFDEVKRSCRKRLDGHNRRRRKPQPEPINTGSLFLNHQGPRFSSFSSIYPSTTPESNWAGIVKTEQEPLYTHNQSSHFLDRQQHFHSYNEGKQFSFLHDNHSSVFQPLTKPVAPMESSSNRVFPNGLPHVHDSDCALSLLSSPIQSSSINVSQLVPPARMPMGQPLVSSLQFGGFARYSRLQASNNVSTPGFSCSGIEDINVGSDTEIQCQGLYRVAGEGSSGVAPQSLPFSWQ